MATLEEYEIGLICIETAMKNGLQLIPKGNEVKMELTDPKADQGQVKLVVDMLKVKKSDVLRITSDPIAIRKALCEAQQALSEHNSEVMALLDRLDRLEKVYRGVFPEDTACIHDAVGCPEDSIMFCSACSTRLHYAS
jgi:hypothetical protein